MFEKNTSKHLGINKTEKMLSIFIKQTIPEKVLEIK